MSTDSRRDLDRDEQNETILGTQNFELHVYDAAWKQLSQARRAVLHGSIDLLAADANLDGKLEIFATDHYGRVQISGHDGVLTLATGDGEMRKRIALDLIPVVAVQLGDSIVVGTGGEVRSFQISQLMTRSAAVSGSARARFSCSFASAPRQYNVALQGMAVYCSAQSASSNSRVRPTNSRPPSGPTSVLSGIAP